MNQICSLQNIYKSYEGIENLSIFEGLNLDVNQGDYISISGNSGIGKSTLLHIMGTLLKPNSGEISFYGKSLENYSQRELDELKACKIGSVFQEFSFIQALNLNDNLKLIYDLSISKRKLSTNNRSSPQQSQHRIDELLERLKLSERKFYLPSNLSGGQKRRAMIIAGLLKDPDLILADEPTNDLDVNISNEVMELFQEFIDKGKSVVLVTHNDKIAENANIHYTICNKKLKLLH